MNNGHTLKIKRRLEGFFAHQLAGEQKNICLSLDYSSIAKEWPSYGFKHSESSLQLKNTINIINCANNQLISTRIKV